MWNDVMSTAETEQLSPVTKAWQEAFGGRHTLVALKSHVIAIGLCILVWRLCSRSLAPLTCHFRDDARLLSLWRSISLRSISWPGRIISSAELCWLVAVTSTTGAIWLAPGVGFEIFGIDNSIGNRLCRKHELEGFNLTTKRTSEAQYVH
jgi:hypothetical protein